MKNARTGQRNEVADFDVFWLLFQNGSGRGFRTNSWAVVYDGFGDRGRLDQELEVRMLEVTELPVLRMETHRAG